VLKAGYRMTLKGDLQSVVLAASGKVITAPTGARPNPLCAHAPDDMTHDGSDNALSLAFKFSLGKFDFFDAGDLTWNIEKQLVCPNDLIGPVDLYQVTHHGMDISNHPTLLKTIDPSVAIMNNGPRKGGAAETVRRLRELTHLKAAYAMHRNHALSETENLPADMTANSDTTGGEFIRVTVDPDGARYRIRIGANGPIQEFESK
jgi:hypothetical protein